MVPNKLFDRLFLHFAASGYRRELDSSVRTNGLEAELELLHDMYTLKMIIKKTTRPLQRNQRARMSCYAQFVDFLC